MTPAPGWLSSLSAPLSAAGRGLLDLLYPPRCAGCGRVGELFCAACRAAVLPIPAPVCRRCGSSLDAPAPASSAATQDLCPTCRRTSSNLDGIIATALFAPPLREAIHQFKYRGGRALAEPLGARLVQTWRARELTADVIAPVALHTSRLRERGYNQSALLARVLGAAVGVPVDEGLLVRQRSTRPQVDLSRAERRQNVSGAFACGKPVDAMRIVVVDDVATTGATLAACAAALKAAGAVTVWGLTLARGSWAPGGRAADSAPAPPAQSPR